MRYYKGCERENERLKEENKVLREKLAEKKGDLENEQEYTNQLEDNLQELSIVFVFFSFVSALVTPCVVVFVFVFLD